MRTPTLGHIPGLVDEFGKDFALELFRRGNYSRNFDYQVKKEADKKRINIPIYLAIGSEFNSAALSMVLPGVNIFGQHRCHGLYLSFGANPEALRDELLGLSTGCSGGMSGSNAIQGKEINMYGHSGLMGEQIPIAVGSAMASGETSLAICGDASVEEDYIYPSLGWAASKEFPVIFICEDNDLSILTKVEVRRSWNPVDVAKSMGMYAVDITDDPWLIAYHAKKINESGKPGFINIRTCRVLWHAGTGNDGLPEWDRYSLILAELKKLGFDKELIEIDQENKNKVEKLWA